jgi:23S rRNA pseudouridine1911/1915/1917 synthase
MNSGYILDEEHVITEENALRLDVYVSVRYPQFTRSFLKRAIEDGFVAVNGKPGKSGLKVKKGDKLRILIPEPKAVDTSPQDIPIKIVYQDKDIAVIDKPQGLVVHPSAGHPDNTLVNALLYHIGDLSGINGELRPGIVHRLDKDTSGLIVIAKNDAAHKKLAQEIKQKAAYRVYLAIVHGNVREDEGVVSAPIGRHRQERKQMAVTEGGREAVTHYRVLERFGDYTLLEARLETGRTHQIRVHMKHIGHPVAGDPVYGPAKVKLSEKGQLLHAFRLGIVHPSTGEEMLFESPPQGEFLRVLENLRKKQPSQ